MYIIIIPIGLLLWYVAYEAKPTIDNEETNLWEEDNIVKRKKIINILKESF